MNFFKLLYGLVKVATSLTGSIKPCFVRWNCPEILKYTNAKKKGSDMGLFKLLHVFVKVLLCISHPLPNNTKLTKLVETSALNKRCWMSQSAQCLGSFVPSEMFVRKLKVLLAHLIHACTYPHSIYHTFKNWCFLVASSQKVNPALGCPAPD